jgi:hypothetical protein
MEYLDAGGLTTPPSAEPAATDGAVRPARRWLPPLIGLAVFLVALVGFGAVAGDWAARNIEMQALITQVEESEAAMGTLQEDIAALAAEYQDRLPLNETDQAAFDAAIIDIAETRRADIAAAGDDVAAVRWLAWHQDVRRAQDAYLAHNQAWQDYLTRAIEDPAEFARPQDAVNSTFEEAEPAVREALPPAALYRLKARVAQIFAPPPSDGDGQQA